MQSLSIYEANITIALTGKHTFKLADSYNTELNDFEDYEDLILLEERQGLSVIPMIPTEYIDGLPNDAKEIRLYEMKRKLLGKEVSVPFVAFLK